MPNPTKRVYWDSCCWIALIQKEKIPLAKGKIEDREQLCRSVLVAAKGGDIEVVVSTLCLTEVCRQPEIRNEKDDKIVAFFEHKFIAVVGLDKFIAEAARILMHRFKKLKPPDAIHLATAAFVSVDEMHTFDDYLLSLDGQIETRQGSKLKICKPDAGSESAPLLEKMQG